jgi:hypothetical protein
LSISETVRPPDVEPAGAHLAGVGLAGVVAAVLRRRGFLISDLGFAATVVAGGLRLCSRYGRPETLDDATTYAMALGVVGVLNVAGGAYQMVSRGTARADAGDGPLTVSRSSRQVVTRRPQTRTARRV